MTTIHHFSSYGKRQEKYDLLNNTEFADVPWQELELKEPYYFFVPKDFGVKEKYDEGFSVSEIFKESVTGIQTSRDNLTIDFTEKELAKKISIFFDKDKTDQDVRNYFFPKKTSSKFIPGDSRSWDLSLARKNNIENEHSKFYKKIYYRPFDIRYVYYNVSMIDWPRYDLMKHLLENNLGIIIGRQGQAVVGDDWNIVSVSSNIVDLNSFYRGGGMTFPLYLYNQQNQNSLENLPEKTPNFNPEIIKKIEEKLGMKMDVGADLVSAQDQEERVNTRFTPTNLFDYIYAVLHSKTYRETYKEFLKIDFPKVPFDYDKETFFKMVELGRELRSYHLMENENLVPKNFVTTYPVDGDNDVGKVGFEDEKVFINDTQYFDGVPTEVWEFYIGGYQPAQKWLKDRKRRKLNYEDILHYSKIILCLKETIRIMEEIEKLNKPVNRGF